MLRSSLALVALGLAVAVPTAEAAAGCCNCAMPCRAPALITPALPTPAPITIWGLSPSYGVNQGPVYSGPGYTTLPTYEGEASTVEYPYVGHEGGYAPYPPYRFYRPNWHAAAPLSPYPAYRHAFYRHLAGPRVLTVSVGAHVMPRVHRPDPDWRDR
jgi:hypothetical protein